MEELEIALAQMRSSAELAGDLPATIVRREELIRAEFASREATGQLDRARNSGNIGNIQELIQAAQAAEESVNLGTIALNRILKEQARGREPIGGFLEQILSTPFRPADEARFPGGPEIATPTIPLPEQTPATPSPLPEPQQPQEIQSFVASDSIVQPTQEFVGSDEAARPPTEILSPLSLRPREVEIETRTEQEILAAQFEEDLMREMGQMFNTFATDKLNFILDEQTVVEGEQPFLMARGVPEVGDFMGPVTEAAREEELIAARLAGPLTLDDIIQQTRRGMAIPMGTLDPREDPETVAIRPIFGPTGAGVIGGVTRSAINMTQALKNDPIMTIAGLVTAPIVITYGGLLEEAQNGMLPGKTLNELRDSFFDFYGRMTYHEAVEARRAFNGLLASHVFARGMGINGAGIKATLAMGGRSGNPRLAIVRAFARSARKNGMPAAQAIALAEMRANQITALGAISSFGFFAAEPDKRGEQALAFSLALIPLSASYTALQFMAGQAIFLNNMIARAAHTSQSRMARPLDTPSAPRPTVRTDTGAIPMGGEVSIPLETPIRSTDVHSSPDFVRRVMEEEAAHTASTRETRERSEGIPESEKPPENTAEYNERRQRDRADLFQANERRIRQRRAREEAGDPFIAEESKAEAEQTRRDISIAFQDLLREADVPSSILSPEFARRIQRAQSVDAIRNIVREMVESSNIETVRGIELTDQITNDLFRRKQDRGDQALVDISRELRETGERRLSGVEERRGVPRDIMDEINPELMQGIQEGIKDSGVGLTQGHTLLTPEFAKRIVEAKTKDEITHIILEAIEGTGFSAGMKSEMAFELTETIFNQAQRNLEQLRGPGADVSDRGGPRERRGANLGRQAAGRKPLEEAQVVALDLDAGIIEFLSSVDPAVKENFVVPPNTIDRILATRNRNEIRAIINDMLLQTSERVPRTIIDAFTEQIASKIFDSLVLKRVDPRLQELAPGDIERMLPQVTRDINELIDTFAADIPALNMLLREPDFARKLAEAGRDRQKIQEAVTEALTNFEVEGDQANQLKAETIKMLTEELYDFALDRRAARGRGQITERDLDEVMAKELEEQIIDLFDDFEISNALSFELPPDALIEKLARADGILELQRLLDQLVPRDKNLSEFAKKELEAELAELAESITDLKRELIEPGSSGDLRADLDIGDVREELPPAPTQPEALPPQGPRFSPEERREQAGRREGERPERRAQPTVDLAVQGAGGGEIGRELVFAALRASDGNVALAFRNLENALRFMEEQGTPLGIAAQKDALAMFHDIVPQGIDVISNLEGFIIQERRGQGKITQADVAAFEAASMSAEQLAEFAVRREQAREELVQQMLGDDFAEWTALKETVLNGTFEQGQQATLRIVEIESRFQTKAELDVLAGIVRGENAFGIERFTTQELEYLSSVQQRYTEKMLRKNTVDELARRVNNELRSPKRSGARGAESTIIIRGSMEEMTRRGLSTEQQINIMAERYALDAEIPLAEARKIVFTQVNEVARIQQQLATIPYQIDAPTVDPLKVARDLHNWIDNSADLVATLVDQVRLRQNQTVIIPNLDTPARALVLAARKLPSDYIKAVHVRKDGTFDLAIGGPGSPLEVKKLRDQFIQEGFMEGQSFYINGKMYEYVGMAEDGVNAVMIYEGKTRLIDPETMRRAKDVELIGPFDKVANAQRGLPERSMLRVQHSQISQLFGSVLEQVGDLTHRMANRIQDFFGGWEFVKPKVDKALSDLRPLEGRIPFLKDVMEQIATNTIVKNNPGLSTLEMADLLALRNRRGSITEDPLTLNAVEMHEFNRLRQLGQEYADAHRAIPVINEMQRIANEAAIAMGEFRVDDAIKLLEQLEVELNKGDAHWRTLATQNNKPTAREALEGILDQADLANFERLQESILPRTAAEMEGITNTVDNVRAELSTNGYDLEVNASGAYTVRDLADGKEQFASTSLKEVREWNNRTGQAEGVVIDGNSPIDPEIPGSVTPPPPPPPRPNEPLEPGFNDPTWGERLGETVQAFLSRWSPAKDFFAGVDAVEGLTTLIDVFNGPLNSRRRSVARGKPWMERLSDWSKRLVAAKIKQDGAEQIFTYNETRSFEDLMGSHLEGKGPLRNRSATQAEKDAGVLLASYDVDSSRILAFVRRKIDALRVEADRIRVNVSELPAERRAEIDLEIRNQMQMTPQELAAVPLIETLRHLDINTHSINVVVRIADAKRLGTLSQAEYAAQNKMTPEQIALAKELDQMLIELSELPDSPIKDVQEIRGYMARYGQEQTADPSQAYLRQPGRNASAEFVNGMIRTGESGAYSRDPIATTAKYISGFFNAMKIEGTSFNIMLDRARQYVKENLQEGTIPRRVSEDFLSSVSGHPPAASRWTEKVVGKFFGEIGIKFIGGLKVKDLVDSYLAITHTAFIAYRPGLAGRDLMQFTFSYYARNGTQRTARALQLAHESRGEIAAQMRADGDLPTIGITEFQTPEELLSSTLGRGLKKGPEMLRRMAENGLTYSGQRHAYEHVYRGTLLESREFYGNALAEMVKNGTSREVLYKKIGLRTFPRVIQAEFDRLVGLGQFKDATNLLSRQMAREIVGEYGMGTSPWGWNTNVGRLATQYGQWSANASAMVLAGLTRGTKAQRMAYATRLAMTQAALFTTGRVFGVNLSRWFLIPGLFFTGGPAMQLANTIVKAVMGYGEEREAARERLSRLYPDVNWDRPAMSDIRSLFPASYAVQDLIFGYQAWNRGESIPKIGGRVFSIPIDEKQSVIEGGKLFQEEE